MFVVLFALIAATTRFISLTPDNKVTKQRTQEGIGNRAPITGEWVKIHYTGWLSDGTVIDSSRTRSVPFRFQIGHGVIEGWSIAVRSMVIGEKAVFNVDWEYGYGEMGYRPVVPPRSNLTFEIELIGIQ
jgi:FKBP-type peptidyl-prolyl cis-trans isomerase